MENMKHVKMPDAYLLWKGQLVQVVGIAESRVIFMRPPNAQPCDECGLIQEYCVVEDSLLFQENAVPIKTIEI